MCLMDPAVAGMLTPQRSSPITSAETGTFEIIALEACSAGGATRGSLQMEESPCVYLSVF